MKKRAVLFSYRTTAFQHRLPLARKASAHEASFRALMRLLLEIMITTAHCREPTQVERVNIFIMQPQNILGNHLRCVQTITVKASLQKQANKMRSGSICILIPMRTLEIGLERTKRVRRRAGLSSY